jgi:hypothetical protein
MNIKFNAKDAKARRPQRKNLLRMCAGKTGNRRVRRAHQMPVNYKLMVRTAHPTLILMFQTHISLQKDR